MINWQSLSRTLNRSVTFGWLPLIGCAGTRAGWTIRWCPLMLSLWTKTSAIRIKPCINRSSTSMISQVRNWIFFYVWKKNYYEYFGHKCMYMLHYKVLLKWPRRLSPWLKSSDHTYHWYKDSGIQAWERGTGIRCVYCIQGGKLSMFNDQCFIMACLK